MGRIVVLGGGVIGLATALLLVEQGHDVTVLERDPHDVPATPEAAWEAWERHGVSQFRQAHYLQAGARRVLDGRLPEVAAALRAAGGTDFDGMSMLPPTAVGQRSRDDDDRFRTLTARRPVVELAFGSVAAGRVDVRRGTEVTGLLTGASTSDGVPHVSGVRLATGEAIATDLVVDAMGRRSRLTEWLEQVGARPPSEESADSGFTYYTRFFRATSSGVPMPRAALLTPVGSFSLLTLPGDSDTWSVTVYISSHDHALKRLREADRWTRVVAACPHHAHWLEGEPITDVAPMGGIVDRRRRFVVDGTPVVTGVVAVGDSWACTNPSVGRGITFGLMHAAATAEVVADHLDEPLGLARAHDEVTESRLTPWYRSTTAADRARAAEIRAEVEGTEAPPTGDPGVTAARAFAVAARYDADVYRAFLEVSGVLATPAEVMSRPGVRERILELAEAHPERIHRQPSRRELVELMA